MHKGSGLSRAPRGHGRPLICHHYSRAARQAPGSGGPAGLPSPGPGGRPLRSQRWLHACPWPSGPAGAAATLVPRPRAVRQARGREIRLSRGRAGARLFGSSKCKTQPFASKGRTVVNNSPRVYPNNAERAYSAGITLVLRASGAAGRLHNARTPWAFPWVRALSRVLPGPYRLARTPGASWSPGASLADSKSGIRVSFAVHCVHTQQCPSPLPPQFRRKARIPAF